MHALQNTQPNQSFFLHSHTVNLLGSWCRQLAGGWWTREVALAWWEGDPLLAKLPLHGQSYHISNYVFPSRTPDHSWHRCGLGLNLKSGNPITAPCTSKGDNILGCTMVMAVQGAENIYSPFVLYCIFGPASDWQSWTQPPTSLRNGHYTETNPEKTFKKYNKLSLLLGILFLWADYGCILKRNIQVENRCNCSQNTIDSSVSLPSPNAPNFCLHFL